MPHPSQQEFEQRKVAYRNSIRSLAVAVNDPRNPLAFALFDTYRQQVKATVAYFHSRNIEGVDEKLVWMTLHMGDVNHPHADAILQVASALRQESAQVASEQPQLERVDRTHAGPLTVVVNNLSTDVDDIMENLDNPPTV